MIATTNQEQGSYGISNLDANPSWVGRGNSNDGLVNPRVPYPNTSEGPPPPVPEKDEEMPERRNKEVCRRTPTPWKTNNKGTTNLVEQDSTESKTPTQNPPLGMEPILDDEGLLGHGPKNNTKDETPETRTWARTEVTRTKKRIHKNTRANIKIGSLNIQG